MSRRGLPWLPEEDVIILRCREDGVEYREVVRILEKCGYPGRTRRGCAFRGRQIGARQWVRPWSERELSQALRLRGLGRKWSEMRLELVLRGHPLRTVSELARKVRTINPDDVPTKRSWTGPEARLALELRAEGRRYEDVAQGLVDAGYQRRNKDAVARFVWSTQAKKRKKDA